MVYFENMDKKFKLAVKSAHGADSSHGAFTDGSNFFNGFDFQSSKFFAALRAKSPPSLVNTN